MVIFSVVCLSPAGNTDGLYHTDDWCDAQLMLHQLAEEYAAEKRAEAVDSTGSAVKRDFLKTVSQLYYVKDSVLPKIEQYRKDVYQTPVVENGILRESYTTGEPQLSKTFELIWTHDWQRNYFSFFSWSNQHSVTIVTNGTEQERRQAIKACLQQQSVQLEQPSSCYNHHHLSLEQKPQPDDSDYKPLYVALSEHVSEWQDFCDHVEPYSDVAIAKIIDEQQQSLEQGEVDDVVIILEASTPNMLLNDMVMELCECCNELQMSVMLSVPLDNRSRLSQKVLDNIHYFFSIHPHTDKSFSPEKQTEDQFETCPVYELDSQVYKIQLVSMFL